MRTSRAGFQFLRFSSVCNTLSQTVGTAQVMVTPSRSISSSRLSASRCGPGSTYFAPTIAAVYENPQPLAWNMGEASSTVSCCENAHESAMAWDMLCSTCERCEYNTPLGFPVVPDV